MIQKSYLPESPQTVSRALTADNLNDRIALEIVGEVRFAHRGFLASNLGKKASRNLGAIQTETILIELSKQRLLADNQFLKIQTRASSHARIVSGTERLIQQRADNMLRQRGLRMAQEASDRQATLTAQASMKGRRRPGFK